MEIMGNPLASGIIATATASFALSLASALAVYRADSSTPGGWGVTGAATVLCAVAGGVAVGYHWAGSRQTSATVSKSISRGPNPTPVPAASSSAVGHATTTTAVAHQAVLAVHQPPVAHVAAVSSCAPHQAVTHESLKVHSSNPPATQLARTHTAPIKKMEVEEGEDRELADPELASIHAQIHEAKVTLAGLKLAISKGRALVSDNMETLERLGEEIENRMRMMEETNTVVNERWSNLAEASEMCEQRTRLVKELDDAVESKRAILADLEMRCQERRRDLGLTKGASASPLPQAPGAQIQPISIGAG